MDRIQIVIDTNVFLSALRSRRGASFRLLALVGQSELFDINPTVNTEVSSGLINGFFDGSDGLGDPVTITPGPTSQPGIYELDLDPSLPGGQPISGSIAFTGYSQSDPTQTPIEVASQSFSIVTASVPSATVAPEPSSTCDFAVVALIAAGLVFRARTRKTA